MHTYTGTHTQSLFSLSLSLSLFQLDPTNPASDRLPPAIVDIRLELTGDEARDAVAEPQVPEHGVVALLVQEQLPPVAEAEVDLAVPVDVGRVAVRTRVAVQVKDAALADVDEETKALLAPVKEKRRRFSQPQNETVLAM